jgi:O-antigen ligase
MMNARDSRTAPRAARTVAPAAQWRRDDRYGVLLTVIMWTLLILMIVPEGFDYTLLASAEPPASGSALSRALWLGLLGAGVLVILWRAQLAWLLLRRLNPFLLLFAALALASVLWSIMPPLTLRRCIRFITILVDCVAFVLVAWDWRRFQSVVRPLLTVVLLGSIVFGIVRPTLAIHQETSVELLNAWHGLTNHKNSLGALSCLGLTFWFHGWLAREVHTAWALAGGAIAVTCLVLSRSATSAMASLAVLSFMFVLMRSPAGLRPWLPYFVGAVIAMLVIYTLAVLHLMPGVSILLSPISAITGKDLSFTGRTEIWSVLTEHIRQHPLLGTGYAAYWSGAASPFARVNGFYPGSAHNGYLDVLNDLGWAGLLCLLGCIWTYARQSLRVFAANANQGALYLGLLAQQGLTNLSETHWFSVLSVDFAIMTLAMTAVGRAAFDLRLYGRFRLPGAAPRTQARPRNTPPWGTQTAARTR